MKRWFALVPALVLVIAVSGCTTQQGEDMIALAPYADIEATVISLSLDESGNYYEGDELTDAPDDSAIVRIDKIVETGGSHEFNWTSVGIEEGKEVSLGFRYTARPAKIITVVGQTTQTGDTISHDIVPTEITFENGYFVFKINGNSETETILSGLEEGTKFKARIWHVPGWEEIDKKVQKYEIIS